MDPNTFEYAQIFQKILDEHMIQELTTGVMERTEGIIYNGGNTVKLPRITTSGMGDYSRDDGYAEGTATLTYQTVTFDMDRSIKIRLDRMDVDETNFTANLSNVGKEFQAQQAAPEIDAYRYSKVFEIANTELKTSNYIPVASTVYQQLKNDITDIQNLVGENIKLVIFMSFNCANILDQSEDFEKNITLTEFQYGEITTTVKKINNIPIIRVSEDRFKSEFTFGSDGFTAPSTSMNLNYIIGAIDGFVGLVKTDIPKIISPQMNQTADAWDIMIRKYHTLDIAENKKKCLKVSYYSTASPALSATVAGGVAGGTTKFTATPDGTNTLAYSLTASAENGYYNVIETDLTSYSSGDDISASVGQFLNMYEIDTDGRTRKFLTHELEAGDIT